MFHELIDQSAQNLVKKKDSIIIEHIKKHLMIVDCIEPDSLFILDNGIISRMHIVVTPGQETLHLDGRPFLTFFPPEMETVTDNYGNVTVHLKQSYKGWDIE